ncbi:MAG TPA: NAD(P) transhydrogenase subunit alpha [Solirubrobacteraceae bacterium]|nr:NAD(P) transhydrogenase subunit alpha [Solirubrobacteraceae bacterium]
MKLLARHHLAQVLHAHHLVLAGYGRSGFLGRVTQSPLLVHQATGGGTLVTDLTVLVLAGFVGFVVISKVPNTLHTPLMSGTNAIHGIVLLGGLIAFGFADLGTLSKILLVIAVAFGTINIVGGFLVTDRMLEMFKSKPKPPGNEES